MEETSHSPGTPVPSPLPAGASAFEELALRWHARLFRVAARMLGTPADADDVVQEAMLRVFRSVQRNQLALAAVSEPLLLKVVTHLSLNWVRGRQRAKARDDAFARGAPASAVNAAEAHLALGELNRLIGELPPAQRAALVLKELEGLSTREVAQALGCSEAGVGQRIARARQTLRKKVSA